MECDDMDKLLDEAMQDLPEQEFFAPDNFEELVMQKIRALPAENKRFATSADSLLCVIWGAFSCLFGLGFLAVINRNAIMDYMTASPALSAYADTFDALAVYADGAANMILETAGAVFAEISGYVSSYRYALLLVISVLALAQFVVYRINKVKA